MTWAPPPDTPAALELFALISVEDAEFAASVERAPEPVGHVLRITCRTGCPRPVAFEQPQGDPPLSLFRRWDEGPLLYTLWATGSAYRVQVFTLSTAGVRRVLDAYSLGRPDFTTGPKGAEVVRITERRTERDTRNDPRIVTFTWTSGRFMRR